MVCIPKILLDVPPTSVPAHPEPRCISTPGVQCTGIPVTRFPRPTKLVRLCMLYIPTTHPFFSCPRAVFNHGPRIDLPDADRRESCFVCMLANARDHCLTVTDSAPLRRFCRYPTLSMTDNGLLIGPHAASGRSRVRTGI